MDCKNQLWIEHPLFKGAISKVLSPAKYINGFSNWELPSIEGLSQDTGIIICKCQQYKIYYYIYIYIQKAVEIYIYNVVLQLRNSILCLNVVTPPPESETSHNSHRRFFPAWQIDRVCRRTSWFLGARPSWKKHALRLSKKDKSSTQRICLHIFKDVYMYSKITFLRVIKAIIQSVHQNCGLPPNIPK